MVSRQDLDKIYNELYGRNFPHSTLSKWVREGRINYEEIAENERVGGEKYRYDEKEFSNIVSSEQYRKKIKALKLNPEDYIGKKSGYLLIKGIVPKNEYNIKYQGTLMYCQCLKCNRKDLIQVKFSNLTPHGNYNQYTCGCGRKERAFLASSRKGISEKFVSQFSTDFEKFLVVHHMLVRTTDKYYYNCPISEYEKAIVYFMQDSQFNAVYNFWKTNPYNISETFYDWAKPSLDHKTPKSRGGDNKLENLQALTVFENLSKRDMTEEEWNKFKIDTNTHSNYFIENIRKEVMPK